MVDAALFLLRLTIGSLLAGHGAQKLFGAFGGPGLQGTAGVVESMGYKPGRLWATAAAATESVGGLLTALGFLNPLGPVATLSVMVTATAKAHWRKPVWVTSGGAELPLTNIAAASAIAMIGPGRHSLDRMFGIRLPRWVSVLSFLAAAGMTAKGIADSNRALQEAKAEAMRTEPSGIRFSEPVSPGPEVTESS